MKFLRLTILYFFFLLFSQLIYSSGIKKIIVSANGEGDFKTLTEAVNSLPDFNYERIIIFIKNGVYNEKIRIEQNYITLEGESRDSTIIRYNQLRSDWDKNKDSIGPGVINIFADDIIIKNLTVENTQPEIGPHAFTIYGKGTRTIITDCSLTSNGADTVSLWDNINGMYYHSDCFFKGAVDFVCPRGWCYIKNSKFYEVKKSASTWHAGGDNINQKFVLKYCDFDGVKGFKLGRHHYEAQFYFLNCNFSKNIADEPVYRVTYEDTTRNRPFNWGKRYYFYNCHKDGGNYKWMNNNLQTISQDFNVNSITPAWTFDYKWDPESSKSPEVENIKIEGNVLFIFFNETLSVSDNTQLRDKNNRIYKYISGAGSNTLRFESDQNIPEEKSIYLKVTKGYIIGNKASAIQRSLTEIQIRKKNEE